MAGQVVVGVQRSHDDHADGADAAADQDEVATADTPDNQPGADETSETDAVGDDGPQERVADLSGLEEVGSKGEDEHGAHTSVGRADTDADHGAAQVGATEQLEDEAPVLLGLGLTGGNGLHLLELLLDGNLIVGTLAKEPQAAEGLLGAAVVEQPSGGLVDEGQGKDKDGGGREADVEGDAVSLARHHVGGLLVDDL